MLKDTVFTAKLAHLHSLRSVRAAPAQALAHTASRDERLRMAKETERCLARLKGGDARKEPPQSAI
ncbi:hypothetical protein ATO13_22046 [Stappia sp. 22II-S9-Z10]|nr:hypothetical protein ATO13_22046 [Stappia sp. 22II-S9-Z10]